ncbi:MAG: flagellar motor switch protein FliN [Candidatus Margulisiibacteriota bacterium]|nr:flagellar motor switch protein FliN [Candidatus Margulisiibacteriota bacterium]
MDVKKVHFPEISTEAKGAHLGEKTISEIPVEVVAELGRTKLSLREILDLQEGSIIELDRLAGEPLDIKVGGQLVAQGEVVAIDDSYGIRITGVNIK